MKVINLIWRDPNGNLVSEQLEQDKFKVRTEPGWLKLDGDDGPVRYIPADKVCLVQFAEVEDKKPLIMRPNLVSDMPNKFQPS